MAELERGFWPIVPFVLVVPTLGVSGLVLGMRIFGGKTS